MKVFVIQLYRDDLERDYCGCWHVVSGEGDEAVAAKLAEAGFGRARDDEGRVTRSFFLAEELDEQVARARRESECYVRVDEARP